MGVGAYVCVRVCVCVCVCVLTWFLMAKSSIFNVVKLKETPFPHGSMLHFSQADFS